jgi:hypothetical protein
MAQMTNYLENAVINHFFRNSAVTSPTTVFVALYTVAPGEAGGGTEVTGAGYARQAVTFAAPSDGVSVGTATLTWTATGGNYGNVVAVALLDASTGGNMLMYRGFPDATINNGDSLDIDPTVTFT